MTDPEKPLQPTDNESNKPWGMEINTFCLLLHLSQLASFVIPGAGIILPIVMWATNKDEHPEVHLHGLIIFNWMLSATIYFVGCIILSVIIIGIPLMIILGILALIFTIIGAVRANDGKYWPYPMSIDFFGVKKQLAAQLGH